jgi:type I restriction enzyme S subunit
MMPVTYLSSMAVRYRREKSLSSMLGGFRRRATGSCEKSQLRAGDLVCVRVGDPGVTAVVPPALDGINCASVMIIRQASTFSSEWLCYAMNSQAGRQNIALVAYGAAQKQYNIGHAVDFIYPTPPQD